MFFHEAGHALAVLAFGGKITEFQVDILDLRGHVAFTGNFTNLQNVLIIASASILPWLIWLIFILAVPRKTTPLVSVIKFVLSVGSLGYILPWALHPLLYQQDRAPIGDDVTRFLDESGMDSQVLAWIALGVFVFSTTLFLLKMKGFSQVGIFSFGSMPELSIRGDRGPVSAMVVLSLAVALGLVVIDFALNGSTILAQRPLPEGYRQVASVDLKDWGRQAGAAYAFRLEGKARIGLYISLRDAHTDYLDIQLTGPDGFVAPMMHAERYQANHDSTQLALDLPAGEYRIIVTAGSAEGNLEVFLEN
jgi:hypothetical protein